MTGAVDRGRPQISVLWTGAAQRAVLSAPYKIYMLALMGLVTALSYMDRNLLNILLVPIQNDIGATDTMMGLLTGTAFAFFYATAAIPVSRIADKGNRRTLLAVATAIWSGATAACGLASTYVHLLLARIGVASGEAAAAPAIFSMIADLYPPNRRATAIGTTLIGTGLGVLFGSFFGGHLAAAFGWRTAFAVVGLPGIFVALIVWLTMPEPVRGASEGGLKPDPDSETIGRTIRYLFGIPTFTYIVLAKSMVQIATQASLIWFPAYLIRVHHMSLTETGLWYGLSIATATLLAAIIAGVASDWLARKGTVWYLRFAILSMVLAGPVAIMLTLAQSKLVAVFFVFLYGFTAALNTTPSMAAALAIVRPRMRGFMTAVTNFCFNLIGAGLGGLLIGALNDMLKPRYGDEAIRYSLLVIPVFATIAAILYFLGTRTIAKDTQKAQMSGAGSSA